MLYGFRIAAVFIFHGLGGNANENWFPWMKRELEKEGHHVIIPNFPNADQPVLSEWLHSMDAYQFDEDTIFIGHSLGVPFLLRLLESRNTVIRAAFLVAGFMSVLPNAFAARMPSFFEKSFDRNLIKSHCREFIVFQSENDPYVPEEKAQELKDELDATLHLIPNGGHLNASAGFLEFPAFLSVINQTLS